MKNTLERCLLLLQAMKKESEKLAETPNIKDQRVKQMAILKLNLMSYVMAIWPNRTAFEEDILILAAAIKRETE